MFAIAFDLVVAETAAHHPRSVSQAYDDLASTARAFGFRRVQASVCVCDDRSLVSLFAAISALKALAWFALSVRDVRGFRVETWSDFTPFIKGPAP